jgi:hypothetical protein
MAIARAITALPAASARPPTLKTSIATTISMSVYPARALMAECYNSTPLSRTFSARDAKPNRAQKKNGASFDAPFLSG